MKNLIKITFLMLTVSMVVACKNKKGEEAKVGDKVENAAMVEGKEYVVDGTASTVMWDAT